MFRRWVVFLVGGRLYVTNAEGNTVKGMRSG